MSSSESGRSLPYSWLYDRHNWRLQKSLAFPPTALHGPVRSRNQTHQPRPRKPAADA